MRSQRGGVASTESEIGGSAFLVFGHSVWDIGRALGTTFSYGYWVPTLYSLLGLGPDVDTSLLLGLKQHWFGRLLHF